MRDFQDTAVYKSPADSAADDALDQPIPCAMRSSDAVEPLAELEASWQIYKTSVAGLGVVDLPAVELAMNAVGIRLVLAVMPEVVLAARVGVGSAVLLVTIVVAVAILVAVDVVAVAVALAVAVARAKLVADAIALVLVVAVAVAVPVAVYVVAAAVGHVDSVEVVAAYVVGHIDVSLLLPLDAVALVLHIAAVVASLAERVLIDAGYVVEHMTATVGA